MSVSRSLSNENAGELQCDVLAPTLWVPVVLAPRLDVDESRLLAVLLEITAAYAIAGFWLTLGNLDVVLSESSA